MHLCFYIFRYSLIIYTFHCNLYIAFLFLFLINSSTSFLHTARKTIFSFSRHPEKMVFPKKLHWNMVFHLLLGKIIFIFPENMILRFRRKMNDDLYQKNIRKYDIFFKHSKKMVFSKRAALGYDLSCIIWKDGIFFPENMIFFPWAERER